MKRCLNIQSYTVDNRPFLKYNLAVIVAGIDLYEVAGSQNLTLKPGKTFIRDIQMALRYSQASTISEHHNPPCGRCFLVSSPSDFNGTVGVICLAAGSSFRRRHQDCISWNQTSNILESRGLALGLARLKPILKRRMLSKNLRLAQIILLFIQSGDRRHHRRHTAEFS